MVGVTPSMHVKAGGAAGAAAAAPAHAAGVRR